MSELTPEQHAKMALDLARLEGQRFGLEELIRNIMVAEIGGSFTITIGFSCNIGSWPTREKAYEAANVIANAIDRRIPR